MWFVLFLGDGNEAFVPLVAEGCFSREATELSAFEVVVKNVRQWFGNEVGFGEGWWLWRGHASRRLSRRLRKCRKV